MGDKGHYGKADLNKRKNVISSTPMSAYLFNQT